MRTLYCNKCDCKVAEIASGSMLMVGMTVLCDSCSVPKSKGYDPEVTRLVNMFGVN